MRRVLLAFVNLTFVAWTRAEVVEVADSDAFLAALTVEPQSNVEIKLTGHVALNSSDISLNNFTSLAIWGACTAAPPIAVNPKPGMCGIDLGAYNIMPKLLQTMTGEIDPLVDWVQLYFDNVAVSQTSNEKFELKATTLWLVDSELSGFQELQLNNGSLYVIDSMVSNMPIGMSVTLYGGATPAVASESTALFVNSTLNIDKFPTVMLMDPADTAGYLVIHDSTFSGMPDAKITFSIAPNSTQTMTVLSDSNVTFYDNTGGEDYTAKPFTLDAVAAWEYHTPNVGFLETLDTDKAPGAAKALDPFGLGLKMPPPAEAVVTNIPPSSPGKSSTPSAPPPGVKSSTTVMGTSALIAAMIMSMALTLV